MMFSFKCNELILSMSLVSIPTNLMPILTAQLMISMVPTSDRKLSTWCSAKNQYVVKENIKYSKQHADIVAKLFSPHPMRYTSLKHKIN